MRVIPLNVRPQPVLMLCCFSVINYNVVVVVAAAAAAAVVDIC